MFVMKWFVFVILKKGDRVCFSIFFVVMILCYVRVVISEFFIELNFGSILFNFYVVGLL